MGTISIDPIGIEAGDPNFYRYVGNSPTNGTDPDGLKGFFANAWNNVAKPRLQGAANGASSTLTGLWHVSTPGQVVDLALGQHEIQRRYRTFKTDGLSAVVDEKIDELGQGATTAVRAVLLNNTPVDLTYGTYVRFRGLFPRNEHDETASRELNYEQGQVAGSVATGAALTKLVPASPQALRRFDVTQTFRSGRFREVTLQPGTVLERAFEKGVNKPVGSFTTRGATAKRVTSTQTAVDELGLKGTSNTRPNRVTALEVTEPVRAKVGHIEGGGKSAFQYVIEPSDIGKLRRVPGSTRILE